MITKQNFKIIGTGSCFPKIKLTADDIDERLGQPKGWTGSQIGVDTRHECVLPETMISMGKEAIDLAIDEANISWDEIDYIIDCSTSQFRPIPCNSVHFQQAIGGQAKSIPCVDIQSTCLGSILAINMANALLASNAYRNIVIVASERALAGINWTEPESAAIVGDGAGAIVLQRTESESKIGFAHESFAEFLELCRVDGGGHNLPVYDYTADRENEFRFTMDGPTVFRVALRHLPPMYAKLKNEFESVIENGLDNCHIIPHQASPKAVELVRRAIDIPANRYHVAMQQTGNLAAASIPTMLDRVRKNGTVNVGDTVMLLGTSAGYSQAALIFEL